MQTKHLISLIMSRMFASILKDNNWAKEIIASFITMIIIYERGRGSMTTSQEKCSCRKFTADKKSNVKIGPLN